MNENVSDLQSIAKIKKRFFFFYNRPIQIRYAATAVILIATTILAYTYMLFSQVAKVLGVGQVSLGYSEEILSAIAMQNFIRAIVLGSVVCVLIAGATGAIWAMLITHRYEGPMVRICKHLREMANGDYSKQITTRKDDEVKELAEAINELAAALEKRHSNSKNASSS